MPEDDSLSELDKIKQVYEVVGDNPSRRHTLRSIGETKPDDDEIGYQQRKDYLEYRRRQRENEINRDITTPIEASKKPYAKKLEIESLALVRSLVTGSWKHRFIKNYYGEDVYGQFIKGKTPDRVIRDINKMEENEPERIKGEIAEAIHSDVKALLEKEDRFPDGNLTYGLELEILPASDRDKRLSMPEREKQRLEVDALQEIGMPIIYDAIREIPIPYSDNIRKQLRAQVEFTKSGFIKPEQRVGTHLNVGGLQKLDENIFILDQIAQAAAVFGEDYIPNTGRVLPDRAQKPLYEDQQDSPKGMPFRVRKNGVIEFRKLPTIENFHNHAKGLMTYSLMLETIGAYQKREYTDETLTEQEVELAQIWEDTRNRALAIFEEYGFNKNDIFKMYKNDKTYERHIGKIRKVVSETDKKGEELEKAQERRKDMANVVLTLRKAARKSLKDTSREIAKDQPNEKSKINLEALYSGFAEHAFEGDEFE